MKKVIWVLLLAVSLVLAGCATSGVTTVGTVTLADGSTVTSVSTMAPQPWGIDGATIDRYQTASVYDPQLRRYAPKTTLVKGDAGFSDGTGKYIISRLPGQLLQAGEILGGATLLRPASTVVTNKNNVKANAVAKPVQFQGQGQIQGQAQGQLQGQQQGQIATGGQGGQGGAGGNGGQDGSNGNGQGNGNGHNNQ